VMLAFLRLVIVLALLVGPLSARTFRTDGARSWGEDAARGIVLLVCATQVLALFGALDLVSVLLAIGAVSVGSLLRGRPLRATLDGLSMQAHQLLYDVLDGEMRPQRVGLRLRAVGDALSEWYRRTGRTVGQLGLLTAVVVWSTWIRLGALLEQASPESAVEFAHIRIAKQLVAEQRFVEGVYPDGLHAFVVGMHLLTRLDVVVLWKLLGPLQALAACGIAWRALHQMRPSIHFGSALLGTASVGLLASTHLGGQSLTSEVTPISLGGLALLWWVWGLARALRGEERERFNLVLQSTVLSLVHPVGTWLGLVCVGSAVALLAALRVRPAGDLVRAVAPSGLAAGAVVIGLYVAGTALGFSAMPSVLDELTPVAEAETWLVPLVVAGLVGSLAILSDRNMGVGEGAAAASLLGLAVVAGLPLHGGPALLPAGATEAVVPLSALVVGLAADVIGGFVARVLPDLRRRVRVIDGATLSLATLLLVVLQPSVATPTGQMQSPESLDVVSWIRAHHDDRTWTVVADPELAVTTMGAGWHMRRDAFLEAYDPEDYTWDPRTPETTVPTPYAFLLVETDYADVDHLDPQQLVDRRARSEALGAWIETYRQTHDDLEKVYTNEDIEVWALYRTPETEREAMDRAWEEGWRP